jgi:hypothetical protein
MRGAAAKPTAGLNQLQGVKRLATSITLVTLRLLKTTMRASAFHITVREVTPAVRAIKLRHEASIDIPLVK